MANKPRLSFWQIWNISFGFLGIQFGWGLQLANLSRIFQTLGAEVDSIAILWIAAPVTGLIVQPIIGYMSDGTWGRLGRRRPYFLGGAILASISLILMPNSSALWMAAGLLWILDASINVSMEPFRAFVGDMLPGDQRTMGFAMQSFFIGIGSVVASLFPWMMTNWLGVSNTAAPGEIPASVVYAFYAGGLVFLSAVAWTVFRVKEYSPQELASFESAESGAARVVASGLLGADRYRTLAPRWLGAGQYSGNAVRHSDRSPSRRQIQGLHGDIQFLYRAAANHGLHNLWRAVGGLVRRRNHIRAADRRRLFLCCRCADDASERIHF